MGTHPSGPSIVKGTGEGLKETIAAKAEEFLGKVTLETFGADLPFLTKVLSVAKALSIQAHPDKTLARALHADRPHVYKDANHKPEMTLAITEFEALCGFVAHDVLVQNLSKVPELRAAAGEDASAAFVAAPSTATLRQVFTAVMTASAETVSESISSLVSRLRKEDKSALSPVDALALRLETQYPGDVGVLCAYLLNYVTLRPGQCIYLAANEPHAYLQGECVECMATSDNVVRAGLTPKLRDTAILCDMLTYNAGEPTVLDGDAIESEPSGATKSNATVRRYVPPFDEFQLETYEVEAGSTCLASVSPGPCVFLVFGGKGEMGGEKVARGSVVFAKADEAVSITAGEEAIVAYRAMINSRVFA
jgi:mannose-6-phosphate isomerase